MYLLIYYANDGVSLAAQRGPRCREVLPQAEILDWASSSVHLDTVFFQYWHAHCITIPNDTAFTTQLSIMGDQNITSFTDDEYTYSTVQLHYHHSRTYTCINYRSSMFAKYHFLLSPLTLL